MIHDLKKDLPEKWKMIVEKNLDSSFDKQTNDPITLAMLNLGQQINIIKHNLLDERCTLVDAKIFLKEAIETVIEKCKKQETTRSSKMKGIFIGSSVRDLSVSLEKFIGKMNLSSDKKLA